MKTHLAWIRMTALGAVVAGASPLAAQYAPYEPLPSATSQPPAPQPAAAPQSPYAAPASASQPAPAAYPQTAAPYVPTASAYPQVATHYPAAQGAYPSVARQPTESLPPPQTNGPAPNGAYNGIYGETSPANGHYPGYGAPAGYPAAHDYHSTGYPDSGISSYFDSGCYETQWFGGVYWLFMQRDRQASRKLTVEVDHAVVPDPYYPPATATVLRRPDHDFRSGVEVRFGSTFAIGSHGHTAHGCAPCPPDVYAWEVAWWGLERDTQEEIVVEKVNRRIYGMKDFKGLQYNYNGGPWRPVNDYYGYELPIPDPGAPPYPPDYVKVMAQRVRTDFSAQNLELNFYRFPICHVPCGPATCGPDGCDPCAPAHCGPALSMFGSCGVRYFRADEDFLFASKFAVYDGAAWMPPAFNGFVGDSNELYYDVQVDNHLVGPQLGWTMNYCWSKFNFFANSTFGIFNNHIRHSQRMFSGDDTYYVRFAGDGEAFDVRSRKNDVAFLGELRVGGSYDLTCHWRAVAAYRAVAISGIATADDQIPDDFTNKEWVGLIDSDNSLIVHGLQLGVECRY